MRVIVHGGAGPDAGEPERRQGVLDEAAATGAGATTPAAAVVDALAVLESSPVFNAGVGGARQSDGVVRTDAGIMTDERAAGAACAMAGVEHAAAVARTVMEETPHVLLAGEHAVALAETFGIETGVDLLTDRTKERWAELDPPRETDPRTRLAWLRERFGNAGAAGLDPGGTESDGTSDRTALDETAPSRADHDTVGAVATDGEDVAAATSTGGRWCALAGRVGDVPQIGSGFYAGPAGGASATGAGEDIARVTLSRRAVDHLECGRDPEDAATLAIEEFADCTGSTAGIIVLDGDGAAGSAFNSEAMQTSVADQ
ncbi:asparaginase [Halobacteriales archaeon QS_4_69_34]|nr:MAG: asparaginase [Halobacteriales archaeon QS_4_69_34]